MRNLIFYTCLFLFSCGLEPKEKERTVSFSNDTVATTSPVTATADTDVSFAMDTVTATLPKRPPVKRPSGTYEFFLAEEDGSHVRHTIAFYPGTFRLQEEYNRDSLVVTEGTWAPTREFIWLYKDQVVRGRYTWKGDTLQYFNPGSKKMFALNKLTPVTTNAVWQTKKREGQQLYGVGTEPFWSVAITKDDSLVVNMPEWKAPLRAKITGLSAGDDSTVFRAGKDSIRLVVYPYFCSDGMSDFLYTRRLSLVYKGQAYRGCGEFLRAAH